MGEGVERNVWVGAWKEKLRSEVGKEAASACEL